MKIDRKAPGPSSECDEINKENYKKQFVLTSVFVHNLFFWFFDSLIRSNGKSWGHIVTVSKLRNAREKK